MDILVHYVLFPANILGMETTACVNVTVVFQTAITSTDAKTQQVMQIKLTNIFMHQIEQKKNELFGRKIFTYLYYFHFNRE